MDISLHQQAISIFQHNHFTRESCNKVGPKQSYKKARVTFTIYSCRTVEQKPKFNLRDEVRIAKQDLPFKKGYKHSFTDEIFTIIKILTFNPPT